MKMIMVSRPAVSQTITTTTSTATVTSTSSGTSLSKPITITVPSQHGGPAKTMTIAPKQQIMETGSGPVLAVSADGVMAGGTQVNYIYFFICH